MISGRQFKTMVDYMFSGAAGFTAPVATFTPSISEYPDTSLPASVILSGTITPNDGTITSWSINEGVNPTPIATGTGTTVSHTLSSVPSVIGTNNYYLTVFYTDINAASQSFVLSCTVTVTATALVGQLALPGDDIIIPGDLTPGIEATLSTTSKLAMINVFPIVAANTSKIIFVIPDSYGAVVRIEDGAGLDVSSQFNLVVDAPNSRKIYTGINNVTPATYNYKIVF